MAAADASVDRQPGEQDGDVLVELDNVHKTYLLGIEGVPALRGVSVSIKRREWVVIYGTSGGGKTTMLNIIGTIDKPTKGELRIGGTTVNPDTPDSVMADIRLRTLGFVFQTFNLLSSMTARENVELPMILKGEKSAKERRQISTSTLMRMGLAHRLDHTPNMLSGGEQQRVTIARAIANRPPLLLLDEPTGDLDSANTRSVIRLLRQLNEEENMTLVMVTHDMYLKNFATRVIWMRDGKITNIDTIRPEQRKQAFEELEEEDRKAAAAQGDGAAGATDGAGGPPQWRRTQIREESDYRMFTFRQQLQKEAMAAL